jgi:hypothetical protein
MSNTTSVSSTASAPVPSPAVLDTMIRVIMSQTEMTEEETKTALERTNYDLKRVIREYMLSDSTSTSTSNSITNANLSNNHTATSTNQLRFSEIRNFMDKSAEQYYRRQEMAKIYNQVLERKKAEAEAAAAASRAGETSTEVQPTNTHPEPESKL